MAVKILWIETCNFIQTTILSFLTQLWLNKHVKQNENVNG